VAAPDRLSSYRSKRDFERTSEPKGKVAKAPKGAPRFVIQQHSATALHWDLRLEQDGVLRSWALTRGLPWTPDENHLAVHTEDHPMQYLDFEGDIPEGEYGGGNMFVWDVGWFEPHEMLDDKVVVTLHGQRAQGRHSLFAFKGKNWLIHRMDPPADPARQPLPAPFPPMKAVPGRLPTGDGWAFEVEHVGVRVLAQVSGGGVDLFTADGEDVSTRFPEVRRMGRAVGSTEVALDGVLAADGGEQAVRRRLEPASSSTVRRRSQREPVKLLVFDCLWWDGHPLLDVPWEERRERLEALALDDVAWATPTAHLGDGKPLRDAAKAQGIALIAKRRSSPYRPGEASKDWRRLGG
jgi:bifunctional non-homologous end joining protein LigD